MCVISVSPGTPLAVPARLHRSSVQLLRPLSATHGRTTETTRQVGVTQHNDSATILYYYSHDLAKILYYHSYDSSCYSKTKTII